MAMTSLLEEAVLAFDQKNYDSALDAAERAIEGDRRSVKAWRLKLAALRRLGHGAQAETVSLQAMKLFPNADWPWGEYAQAAAVQGDVDEAMRRFADLRTRMPKSAAGFAGAIQLARSNSQHALAKSLLSEALEALPGNEQIARLQRGQSTSPRRKPAVADIQVPPTDVRDPESTLAAILTVARRASQRKANRALALTMFDTLHENHPDYAPGYAAHIECLLQGNGAAKAASLAESALERFPDHFGVNVAGVKALSAAGDFDGALARLADMKTRFPDAPAIQAVHIHVLADADRESEAERLAETALSTWPREPALWREYARTATRRGDWTTALDRWLEAQRHRPDDRSIARQVDIARTQLCQAAPAEVSSSVFDRFVSLGGEPLGCEFGIVQRDAGADSVGLLRWAAISYHKLIDALDNDLAGFGSVDQTQLTEVTEYYGLRDTRYGLFTHTFVKRTDAPHDKMLTQSCRRMRFLADKLREELEAGEKIFVYKSAPELLDSEMASLHDAVMRRGGKVLLCLQLRTDQHAPGSVRLIRPDLFVGHVEFFMNGDPTVQHGRFDTEAYKAICTQVAALVSMPTRPLDLVGTTPP